MIEDEAGSEQGRAILLDLFTEISILEHLVRLRFEPSYIGDLKAAQYGVLNYFCRLRKSEEGLATLAFSFQVEPAAMQATVETLVARGLLTIDQANNPCVRITPAGRSLHAEAVGAMAPEVLPVVAEIAWADLRITADTLKEIRRTFDNLPDR